MRVKNLQLRQKCVNYYVKIKDSKQYCMCELYIVRFIVTLILPLQKRTVPYFALVRLFRVRVVYFLGSVIFWFPKYITPFHIFLSIQMFSRYLYRPKDVFSESCMYRRIFGFLHYPSSVLFNNFFLAYHYDEENIQPMITTGGPWWRSWLRHCATSQKVAGSIPDGVIGIFH